MARRQSIGRPGYTGYSPETCELQLDREQLEIALGAYQYNLCHYWVKPTYTSAGWWLTYSVCPPNESRPRNWKSHVIGVPFSEFRNAYSRNPNAIFDMFGKNWTIKVAEEPQHIKEEIANKCHLWLTNDF